MYDRSPKGSGFNPLAALAVPAMVACTLFVPQKANATLMLSADISGTLFTCVDNTACDSNPTVGLLALGNNVVPTVINGVTVLGSISLSTGTASTPGVPLLSSSSLSVTNVSGATRTITVAVSDTNFVGPANFFSSSGSGTFVGNPTGSMTLNYYDDPTNQQGATSSTTTPGNLLDSFSYSVPGTSLASFSHNNSGALSSPDTGPFSLTEQFSFVLQDGGALVSRGQALNVSDVFEPASLSVLSVGLVGLGFIRRRRGQAMS